MMNAKGLQLLLPLLTTSWPRLGSHNISFVESVMERATKEERCANAPIFVGRHVNCDDLSQLLMWLHTVMGTATYFFDGTPQMAAAHGLRNHIQNDALNVLFCRSSEEPIWEQLDKRLRKLRKSRLIVSLPRQRSSSQIALRVLFQKLWSLQLIRVVVLHNDHIYGYTPYPTLRFFELTNASAPLFPPNERNFHGYVVSTPAENDLPRVFFVTDAHTGRRNIRGYGYRIFVEFLRRHNATLHVSNAGVHYGVTTSVNMSNINQLIGANKLEISMHPYTGIDEQLGMLSYPLLKALNCLIVPVRNEIPRYMYLLRPFSWHCWLLIIGGIFYIALALYWLSPAMRGSCGERAMFSILESLRHLLFLSPSAPISAPNIRYFLLALQLSMFGFLVTNWYSNQLSSFLTAILVGEQVDTFEQLIAQRQRILSKHYEVTMLIQQVPTALQPEVERLVDGVNASEQVTALLSFNRTYAYPFTVERWQFFELQQQYANKPVYRYSSICFGAPVIGYPMRKDSHFESPLKHFIMGIQSTGLFQYWLVSDFNDALKAGYVSLIDNQLTFKSLDLDTLRLAWLVLVCGWVLAAAAFLSERWSWRPTHSF
ncbi:uncharacterized protein LOC115627376 [Scaptodrosophila lebanonensis]|uniref:Uncharacterized protein LOC115627376 n=1 Tax=Drosophila lebanonensis TaxID=7225 RepID=A0A6J2TS49_DROLE|nr:uncharacterized protein LOC115627376 [Scaptodrosophila lebanonensis]